MKKLGLVLGSGGSRGVAHIGFIKAMVEEGITPSVITGSSMGALVGACFALGLKPDYMINEITKLKMSDLLDISINPLRNLAILRSKKVYKRLEKYFGNKTFADVKIPYNCVAVDVHTGKAVTFDPHEKIVDGVVASCCIPGVFKPVVRGEQMLVDGGIQCRLPIDEARSMGAEVIVAVDVMGELRPNNKKYNILSVMFRTADIYDTELTKIKLLHQKPDLYLLPKLGDMNQYKFKGISEAIEQGYELGKEYAEKIKELLKN